MSLIPLAIKSATYSNVITALTPGREFSLKDSCTGYSVTMNITVNTPAAAVFTAVAGTDVLTSTNHGFVTGLKGQASNSGGALPTGMAAVTDYFVIVIDDNTYYLATSLANALAGTKLDFSTNGTGTQTFTPTAIAGASYRLWASIDGISYVPVDTAVNITASADILIEKLNPMYNYIKIIYTLTAGMMTIQEMMLSKGNKVS